MSNNDESQTKEMAPSDAAPDPQFMKKFEEVLDSWAEATSTGKTAEANLAAMQALLMAGEESRKNPSPEVMLKNEADDLESKGNWREAEAVRRKVVDLAESSGHFGRIAGAQLDLCRLLRLVGRREEAWQLACAAAVSARRTKIFPLLVTALVREAFCALDEGDSAKALAAASEAVQVVEPGKLYDHERARALTTRARCLLAHGDPASAESDLASAWDLLEAKSASWMMPGIIWTLANWWEVKSRLAERLGNLVYAREAMTAAIACYRQLSGPHALVALARALEKLGEMSRACGDVAVEARSLGETKSIRQSLQLSAGS
jgi:tetratricopeptide (TPR) repeat protein